MTIKQQADAIVERYRPYVYCYLGSGMLTNDHNEEVQTRCATLCAIQEVEARIEEVKPFTPLYFRERVDDLTAILNELKSRV